MSSRARVALLGAGIGAEHLHAYRALPDLFDVALICDTDRERAEWIARGLPVAGDVETALADPAIDIVDICLPPHLHAPVAIQALQAGKHVICEKPLATAPADVARIEAASRAAGRRCFPVFQYRFGEAMAAMRALIDAGIAGKPFAATVETHWRRGADYYDVDWRGTWAGEQGGAVLGHAIHAHDLLTALMGPVAAVSAHLATRVNRIETEDCAAISLRLATGAVATSSITLGAAADETRLRLLFDGLTAESGRTPYAPMASGWTFTARDPAAQAQIDRIVEQAHAPRQGFEGLLSAVAEALAGRPSGAPSMSDAKASIELVAAIYAAARTGAEVALPLDPAHPIYAGWTPE